YIRFWEDEKLNDNSNIKYDQDYINAHLSISCYYYFSPQLRLQLSVSENYVDSSTLKKPTEGSGDEKYGLKDFSSNIYASFVYSIF
ncbi:MAG: hypothetical protein WC341_15335, partial [Bacteroidales bacterium]